MREEAILFGRTECLVGIVTDPSQGVNRHAIILLNAGLVHRVVSTSTW